VGDTSFAHRERREPAKQMSKEDKPGAGPEKPDKRDDEITVIVSSQRGEFVAAFKKTAKIADVITTAAKKLGFAQGDRLELVLESDRGTPLNPHRTLESYHLKDSVRLLLTAIGSGV
jgi:hypothetical protein